MTLFLWSAWRSIPPRVRSWSTGLLLAAVLGAVAITHPVLLLVGPALFVLFVLGGMGSALVEIRRDRRTAREEARRAC